MNLREQIIPFGGPTYIAEDYFYKIDYRIYNDFVRDNHNVRNRYYLFLSYRTHIESHPRLKESK